MIKSLKMSFFVATGLVAYASAGLDTGYLLAKDTFNPRVKPELAVACLVRANEGHVLLYTNSKLIEAEPNSRLLLTHTDSIKAAFDGCKTTLNDRESRDFQSVRWAYWSEFDGETGLENLALGGEQRDEITGQELSFPLGNKIVASQAVEGLEEIESYVNSLDKVFQANDLSLSNGQRQIKKKIIEENPDLAQDGWKRWGLDLVL